MDEEFDNELSSDDSDYQPGEQPHNSGSEISGPDYDDQENSDDESGTKKQKKGKSKRRASKAKQAQEKIEEVKLESKVDPEEEKRRADALWAEFLGGTDESVEPKKTENSARATTSTTTTSKVSSLSKTVIPPAKAPSPVKIFEFAGETVEIPSKNVEQEKPSSVVPKVATPGIKRSAGGGLSSVLNQLTKKNKLSVLEKTKLDWDGFKSNEGINEELQTHNRGRDG